MWLRDKLLAARIRRVISLTLLVGVMMLAGLGGGVGAAPALDGFEDARQAMVARQLQRRDITDPRVLVAMGTVPRHRFVPEALASRAYGDYPLPIGEDQTISQPYIVALMTQWAQVAPEDRVLEVGTGSGYQAAVLAELADRVYSIEIRPELARQAAARLKDLGYGRVQVRAGDGYQGWPEAAPFDAILVTAAAPAVPPALTRPAQRRRPPGDPPGHPRRGPNPDALSAGAGQTGGRGLSPGALRAPGAPGGAESGARGEPGEGPGDEPGFRGSETVRLYLGSPGSF